jgi:hypothetical protein
VTAPPWWAGLDDPALAALGSAGLLRRARTARIGAARVTGATAEVEVDGLTVTLGAKGIGSVRCPCPATGLCLHVLAAILALRADGAAPAADVAAEIAGLPEAEVIAFAGSDLAAALRLVRGATLSGLGDPAASLTLPLPGLSHPVTFLAGAGLRGAVWKGADTRRRLAVAAAALALRAAHGLSLPEAALPEAAGGYDQALLAAISERIEASVAPVLAGCGALAADGLLDLSLSARIDAAPRLAAALRGLVQLAVALDDRTAGADPTDFLIAAARAQALVHALAGPEPDVRLAGVLRRDYQPVPALNIAVLGARVWRSPTGSRGLRLWGWDAHGQRWIATGAARPDGLDTGFDPVAVYRRPMLGLASAAQAMGMVLEVSAPLLSDDLRLAADSIATVLPTPAPALPEERTWPALVHRVRGRLGPTLLRDGQVAAALLEPAVCDAPVQEGAGWVLPLRDDHGQPLSVALDGLSTSALVALARLPRGARLLVEAREALGRLRFDLVSVLHGSEGRLVWNPTLDPPPDWPQPGWLGKVMPWIGRPRDAARPQRPQALAEELLLAALEMGQGQAPAPDLAARIAAGGSAALDLLLSPPGTAAKALRLAFIAAELRGKADQ